jgi:hypothetical protein
MARFDFKVTARGVEAKTVEAKHGDEVYFMPDRDNPPPANGRLGVTSLTAGVNSSVLFNEVEVPLSGDNAVPRQVQVDPGGTRIFAFEIGPDWDGGVSGQGGGGWIPTRGKINVGSGGGGDNGK